MPGPLEYMGVRGPEPASYQAPAVDFSWLANLVPQQQGVYAQKLANQLREFELRQYQDFYGGGGQQQPSGRQTSAEATTGQVASASSDPRGKIPVIVAAAQKYGVDPATAVRVARSEGLASFSGDGGKSGGAFQLYTGGGLGNDFKRDTGLDPLDPKNEDATIDYAMMKAAKGGWTPWVGARKMGLAKFQGIGQRGKDVAVDVRPTPAAATPSQGTGTSAPAPQGDFPAPEEAEGGPPFAPMLGSASSPNASGPANIKLASASNDISGILPTPQTPNAGPLMAGLTPRAAAAPMGQGAVPQGPTPQQPPVRMAEAPGAAQPVPPARAPASPVSREPENDPRIQRMDAEIRNKQQQLDYYSQFAIPPAQRRAQVLESQIRTNLEERNRTYERLTHERAMQLDTIEQDKRGRQAAQTAVERKESEDSLKYLRDTSEEGLESRAHVGQLEQIKKLGETAPYGGLAMLKEQLGRYGVQTQGLTDIQAYKAAIDFMAPQLRPPGSGRLMANEMSGFKAALGGLMTTPEGRSIAVDNLSLMSKYKIEIGKIARQTHLSPEQRIEKISEVPFPHLRTEAPSAPGQPGAAPAKLPPGKYRYNPDGSLTPQ